MELKRKEQTYKGKTIEELQKLEVREFAELVSSRQKRTILRNFQEIEEFINRAKKTLKNGRKIRTHKRHLVIVPQLVGMKLHVYNGHVFVPFEVTLDMLGHRFGEFSVTRVKAKHTKTGVGATKGSKAKSKK